MTAPPPPAGEGAKQHPEALVLRGRPRAAVRFRRGLIIGVAGGTLAAVAALSWLALEPPRPPQGAAQVDGGELAPRADHEALADAPSSYADVPRLGPPLPGDLGRAIVDGQRRSEARDPTPDPGAVNDVAAAATAERERSEAALRAARSAPLLVQLERPARAAAPPAAAGAAAAPDDSPLAPEPIAAGAQRKIAFARSFDGDRNRGTIDRPPSPWTLSAGSVIPANLVTGLDSDLPGTVIAQVSENVRDSATGTTVLIPQGARLIGAYDSMTSYGQRRALLVWTRILFPDGSSVRLDRLPATDRSGYAGLHDRVDSHGWQLLKGIALSTLLGVSSQLSLGGGGEVVRALRQSAQQSAGDSGDRITGRNLDVQPTIRVRPGWPVDVLVSKDLVLKPWRSE